VLFRYSRWDGSQSVPDFSADDVLDEIADDVLGYGDLKTALQRLLQQGMTPPEGRRTPGLRDLLEKLRQRRQDRLKQHDLGSAVEDIARKLEQVMQTEREAIERRLEGDERLRRQQALEQVPPDAAGRLRELQRYDFFDADARRQFEELLGALRQQMMQPFMQGMQNALQTMSPEDLRRLREMIQDLNRMLAQRANGEEPDFEAFKQKWGDHFPGAESLDDLLEQLGQRMAAMQSLMQSLSPGQRQQLDEMMRSLFLQDERLEAAMRQLGMHLSELLPIDEMAQRYPFQGDQELSLQEAMRLVEELQKMDALERELKGVRKLEDLDRVDADRVAELAGEEARRDLERLQEIARKLEEAGYLEREGGELTLTARAIRKIADKALRDIFARLKRDRFGGHAMHRRGAGGDQTDESKPYEFGDPFLLDLRETVMNAVERRGRLRGRADGAADAGGHRGHARHEPLHAEQRLLPARQEGGAGPVRAHPGPVPAGRALHRRLLALRARVHGRPAAHALVERVEHGHEHARGVHAVAQAARPPHGGQQADPHGHRRRADGAHGGRRGRLLVPAHPADR
jgi:uncharacterized protein with von Willebrand factor type A (vWA) domain